MDRHCLIVQSDNRMLKRPAPHARRNAPYRNEMRASQVSDTPHCASRQSSANVKVRSFVLGATCDASWSCEANADGHTDGHSYVSFS